jgi:hypothetical protein
MKDLDLNQKHQHLKKRELVLYNSINYSFNETASLLYLATKYDLLQCEQLALFIKLKGYATIRIGDAQELLSVSKSLELVGLFNTIIH